MGGRRRAGALGAAAAAVCLLAACSLGSGARHGPAEARAPEEVRIWIAPIVRWEAGGDRALALALENVTSRTLVIAVPDPANVRVDVLTKGEAVRLCGVEPRPEAPAAGRVELAPGDRVSVRVDLAGACAGVPAGEYRYEVSYRSPAPAPAPAAAAGQGGAAAPRAVSGTLRTSYGEILVEAGAAPRAATSAPRAARRPPRGR